MAFAQPLENFLQALTAGLSVGAIYGSCASASR